MNINIENPGTDWWLKSVILNHKSEVFLESDFDSSSRLHSLVFSDYLIIKHSSNQLSVVYSLVSDQVLIIKIEAD